MDASGTDQQPSSAKPSQTFVSSSSLSLSSPWVRYLLMGAVFLILVGAVGTGGYLMGAQNERDKKSGVAVPTIRPTKTTTPTPTLMPAPEVTSSATTSAGLTHTCCTSAQLKAGYLCLQSCTSTGSGAIKPSPPYVCMDPATAKARQQKGCP